MHGYYQVLFHTIFSQLATGYWLIGTGISRLAISLPVFNPVFEVLFHELLEYPSYYLCVSKEQNKLH